MILSAARSCLLLVVASSLHAASAFLALPLAGVRISSAARVSSKLPVSWAAAPLPQLRSRGMVQGGLLRVSASAVFPEAMSSEDTTLGDELVRRIAAAKKGDTIVLEKGVYNLEATLEIDKQLTLTSAEGLTYRDVLIQGYAPDYYVDNGLILVTGQLENEPVIIRGVSVYYREGTKVAKSSSIRVDRGSADIQECHLYADMGSGLCVDGPTGHALVQQCRIGPCCWNGNAARLGYGIVADAGAKLRVVNSEISHCSKSGVACAGSAATQGFVSGCKIRACGISAIAAEGMNTVVQCIKLNFGVVRLDPMAEFGGGKCVFLDDSYTEWQI